jgi:hypothetical protein
MAEKVIAALRATDDQIAKSIKYITGLPTLDPSHPDEVMPAAYTHRKDPPMLEKQQIASLMGADPALNVTITDEDVAALREKAWTARAVQFNEWVAKRYKPETNPAAKELLHKVHPGYFQQQIEALKDWHQMKEKIEEIKVKGAQSVQDLYIEWQLEQDVEFANRFKSANAPETHTAMSEQTRRDNLIRNMTGARERVHTLADLRGAGLLGQPLKNREGAAVEPAAANATTYTALSTLMMGPMDRRPSGQTVVHMMGGLDKQKGMW